MGLILRYNFSKLLNNLAWKHIPSHPDRHFARDVSVSDLYYTSDLHIAHHFRRTSMHRDYLNRFADLYKPGLQYPFHDFDKLLANENEIALWSMFTCSKVPGSDLKLDTETKYLIEDLHTRHKLTHPHHPEFWEYAWLMPRKSLVEYVCDCCSLGFELDAQNPIENAYEYHKAKKEDKVEWTKAQKKFIEQVFAALITSYNYSDFAKIKLNYEFARIRQI